jgi:hypothetical protein
VSELSDWNKEMRKEAERLAREAEKLELGSFGEAAERFRQLPPERFQEISEEVREKWFGRWGP